MLRAARLNASKTDPAQRADAAGTRSCLAHAVTSIHKALITPRNDITRPALRSAVQIGARKSTSHKPAAMEACRKPAWRNRFTQSEERARQAPKIDADLAGWS